MAGRLTDDAAYDGDRALVDAVLAGNSEAFRALVDRESSTVLSVCRRILSDPTEAEDAAQDAFLTAYRKLGSYRSDGPLGGWLMRIAIREAHRHGRRHPATAPLDPLIDESVEMAASESVPDPATVLEAHEHEYALRAAVDDLPNHFRDAVRLRYFEDRSYEEIARATGRTEATVRAHVHRGLLRLRKRLVVEPRP